MKTFSAEDLDRLSLQAKNSPRQRQHRNIHLSHQEACQRLFNAIEPDSYIPPHRHADSARDELLIAVRGQMALVTFDAQGSVSDVLRFGTEKYGSATTLGAELDPQTWHTVVALVPGSILLEVKAGPFDPTQPKELAPWAPAEGSQDAVLFLRQLHLRIRD